MGYAFVMSPCCNCGRTITYHPHKVPSLKIDGKREPLCQACAEKWNEIHRTSKGLPPVPIQDGAYEACREEEL